MNKIVIPVLVTKGTTDDARRFTISSEIEDRDGDILVVRGAVLDNYRKNPTVLWAHDYRALPIGRSRSIEVRGSRLEAEVEFAPSAFAQEVKLLVDHGFIKAASVGFDPIEKEPRTDSRGRAGYRYTKWELWEWSLCPVPSNPSALVTEARAKGLAVGALEAEYLRAAEESPLMREAAKRVSDEIILRLAPSEDFLQLADGRMPVSTLRYVIEETVRRSLAFLPAQAPDHVLRLDSIINVKGMGRVKMVDVVNVLRDVIEDELRVAAGRAPRKR